MTTGEAGKGCGHVKSNLQLTFIDKIPIWLASIHVNMEKHTGIVILYRLHKWKFF